MIQMMMSAAIGFIGHQLEIPTAHWFPRDGGSDDVNRLVSYVEGGLLILLAFALWVSSLLPRKQALQAISVLAGVLICVGSGTVLGFIADGLRFRILDEGRVG